MDAQDPKSFICTFITNQQDISWRRSYVRDSFPIHKEFDESKYAMVDVGGGLEDMVEVDEIEQDYIDEHGMALTKDANGYVKLGGTANGN